MVCLLHNIGHRSPSEKVGTEESLMEHLFSNNRRMRKVYFIIEHLEPVLGKWIWLEYRHVSSMVGCQNLLFTNVRKRNEASKLKEIGNVTRKSIVNLRRSENETMIILDPLASNPLSPGDFSDNASLIVGGILGDHPPRGRTKLALTDRIPYWVSRNLGPHQFSVDGAVHIALEVSSGKSIADIPVEVGVEVKVSKRHSSFLPFAYPLVRGRPLLAPGLTGYLRKGVFKDEEILFRTGRAQSVAQKHS
jgi:ribosome biogenesis SPOUT family RNA methylase Rps3